MKNYFLVILMLLIPSQATACLESLEKKENRFRQYDTNQDGYIDAKEWNEKGFGSFEWTLKYKDKDGDKKLSKEEFLEISFVRGC